MRRRHEPRGQPHFFVLPPNLYNGPPVGGTFWFQIFIQASSPEIWSETISGGEEVLAGKWGGLVLGYLLGKIFRRRDRDRQRTQSAFSMLTVRSAPAYPHRFAAGLPGARLPTPRVVKLGTMPAHEAFGARPRLDAALARVA